MTGRLTASVPVGIVCAVYITMLKQPRRRAARPRLTSSVFPALDHQRARLIKISNLFHITE